MTKVVLQALTDDEASALALEAYAIAKGMVKTISDMDAALTKHPSILVAVFQMIVLRMVIELDVPIDSVQAVFTGSLDNAKKARDTMRAAQSAPKH